MRIGIISDTHGLLRPEVLAALDGVDHILHAGDVGIQPILDALAKIAPVTAIRGNIDISGACCRLPESELIELGGKSFYLIHSLNDLDLKPEAAGIDVVISGHSHQHAIETRRGVLYLNPGSAGPRRFTLPVSLAFIYIENHCIRPEIVELTVSS
jgi:putative phosphoesterase